MQKRALHKKCSQPKSLSVHFRTNVHGTLITAGIALVLISAPSGLLPASIPFYLIMFDRNQDLIALFPFLPALAQAGIGLINQLYPYVPGDKSAIAHVMPFVSLPFLVWFNVQEWYASDPQRAEAAGWRKRHKQRPLVFTGVRRDKTRRVLPSPSVQDLLRSREK